MVTLQRNCVQQTLWMISVDGQVRLSIVCSGPSQILQASARTAATCFEPFVLFKLIDPWITCDMPERHNGQMSVVS